MTLKQIIDLVLKPAYRLLPHKMYSNDATAMMLAIGLQESRFQYRRQIRGPARGFWQFEEGGGVYGVMNHHATRDDATRVIGVLVYPHDQAIVHQALADNDVLAACFARLLLYTDPMPLPKVTAPAVEAQEYYLRNWRPRDWEKGGPHPETWPAHWAKATQIVQWLTREGS